MLVQDLQIRLGTNGGSGTVHRGELVLLASITFALPGARADDALRAKHERADQLEREAKALRAEAATNFTLPDRASPEARPIQ